MRRRLARPRVVRALRGAAAVTLIVAASCKAASHDRALTRASSRAPEPDSAADLRPDTARASLARRGSRPGGPTLPRVFLDTKPAASSGKQIVVR